MTLPSVLIVTPIYDKKDYCLDKHVAHVNAINYPNCKQIFIDNTEGSDYTNKLKSKGLEVYHVNRGNNSREAICNSMNYAREYMLEHKFSYMLTIESDLFPDPELINRLLSHNKSVVGSYYLLGFKQDTIKIQNEVRAYHNKEITEQEYKNNVKGLNPEIPCLFIIENTNQVFQKTRILNITEGLAVFNTGLRKIHGCGLGATMVKQDIIQRFPFWCDDRFSNKHHDVYFYMDLHNAGIPVYVDTSILIPHQPSKWEDVKDM